MTDIKKFLFDTHDFSNITNTTDAVTYTEEQLLLAKEQSFNEGKTTGLSEAKQKQEELIANILQKTMSDIETLISNEKNREVQKTIDSIKIAFNMIHKLIPHIAKEHSLLELEGVITKTIEARKDEPRITIKVEPSITDALKARIDPIAKEKSYSGELLILADENIAGADCHIEWNEGGAERLYNKIFTQIENELKKATSALNKEIGIKGEEDLLMPEPEEPTKDTLDEEETTEQEQEQEQE